VLETGDQLYALVERLFPLPRSLTGAGLRQTLAVLAEELPLQFVEVPSGTAVLDWTVPHEWSVREAHVTGPDGERLVDWADGPLHLVGHSAPFRGRVDRARLLAHLHSLPDRPTLTPYRTSYYADTWGFCLPHERIARLVDGNYDVVVDTDLAAGSMTYGELVVPGRSADEVLVSAHVCHPAQANDNLSGIAVAAGLAWRLLEGPTPRHTFRSCSLPAPWAPSPGWTGIATTRSGASRQDSSSPAWVTRRHRRTSAAGAATRWSTVPSSTSCTMPSRRRDCCAFTPYGYDERQFCSPGFDLPVGRLGRGVHGEYPEYHTSADDLSFVSADRLAESSSLVASVVEVLEEDQVLVNQAPYGEPQLGRRGLYRSTGATRLDARATEMALLWTLSLCDGSRSLLAVAEQADLPFASIAGAARRLKDVGLVA
jgi:aminopeptidase-like protein